MAVAAPPRPPDRERVAGEPQDALIEEARRRARRRRIVVASVAGAVVLVGLAVFVVSDRTARSHGSSPGASARPPVVAAAERSRIAFFSTRHFTGRGQNTTLYVVDADGGGKRVLMPTVWIDSPDLVRPPAWSPDGRMIAFLSVRAGNEDVYVLDLGSGRTQRVTRDPGHDRQPAWSPDGRRIAFVSDRFHGPSGFSSDLYVVNADGSGERRLTHDNVVGPTGISYPAWSPDGRKIAFAGNGYEIISRAGYPARLISPRSGHGVLGHGIYVVDADGSGLRRLGPGGEEPKWSPDGRRIVYVGTPGDGHLGVYVMNADGTAKHRVAYGDEPSWSPDGTKIALLDEPPYRNPEVYVVKADGTGLKRLTHNLAWDQAPVWSPDGKMIAFLSLRDGNGEVYVMNADGSDQRSVSSNPARGDGLFAWSPLPR